MTEPVILVSSRDGADVPHVANAAKLTRTAEANGWTAVSQYALAEMPASGWRLGSVAVLMDNRKGRIGWATWHQRDNGPWRFHRAYLGMVRHTFGGLLGEVSA